MWPAGNLPTDLHKTHMRLSPSTPFSIVEVGLPLLDYCSKSVLTRCLLQFQGGSYDPFGGYGFDQCYKLVNHEFSRVFDKNNLAAGVNIFNIYMVRADFGPYGCRMPSNQADLWRHQLG